VNKLYKSTYKKSKLLLIAYTFLFYALMN